MAPNLTDEFCEMVGQVIRGHRELLDRRLCRLSELFNEFRPVCDAIHSWSNVGHLLFFVPKGPRGQYDVSKA